MKRADLETFLGKMVELKLFDGSVILLVACLEVHMSERRWKYDRSF